MSQEEQREKTMVMVMLVKDRLRGAVGIRGIQLWLKILLHDFVFLWSLFWRHI